MKKTAILVFWMLMGLLPIGLIPVAWGQATMLPPRLILNRGMFLLWNMYTGGDFAGYAVYASTDPGFAPSSGNRIFSTANRELNHLRVTSLMPSTTYYFKLHIGTSGALYESPAVSATTLPDGVNETQIPVLMYHNVQPRNQFPPGYADGGWVDTQRFDELLWYMNTRNMHAITHQEILAAKNGVPLPANPVLLTFDDGYENFYSQALPILLARDCVAVNALVTRKMGGYNDWAMPSWPAMQLMTWSQAQECERHGMWLGAHTQTHINLHTNKTRLYEIKGSADDIAYWLWHHPQYFCYPWGHGYEDGDVLGALSSAGYTAATMTFNSFDNKASVSSYAFQLPRIFTSAGDSLYALVSKMKIDTDKDTLLNHVEMSWGLADNAPDTDGDGLNDGFEAGYDGNLNAYNPGVTDLDAKKADTDGDGLNDKNELFAYQSNPLKSSYFTPLLSGSRLDFDGDSKADLAVFFPQGGNWYLWYAAGGSLVQNWGWFDSMPAPGDYDGDGKTDIAVYWPAAGNWYILYSGGGSATLNWGWSEALPAPGDYDGDGKTDIAVYWPKAGNWYVLYSGGGSSIGNWGWSAAIPVPGDYDGDGRTDRAVYWPGGGAWYISYSAGGSATLNWGWNEAVPVPVDYDGDRKTDLAVYWPAGGTWYLAYSAGGSAALNWGWKDALPVPADYDGDSKADLTVYWPGGGTWYICPSATLATRTASWGWNAAMPAVPLIVSK